MGFHTPFSTGRVSDMLFRCWGIPETSWMSSLSVVISLTTGWFQRDVCNVVVEITICSIAFGLFQTGFSSNSTFGTFVRYRWLKVPFSVLFVSEFSYALLKTRKNLFSKSINNGWQALGIQATFNLFQLSFKLQLSCSITALTVSTVTSPFSQITDAESVQTF